VKSKRFFRNQFVPIVLTTIIFFLLAGVLYWEILLLNKITTKDIVLKLAIGDILVGLIIYLKTSVDFAIFMGNLMAKYPGWKSRIAIETGTAIGNAVGTIAILALWNIFRNITWILAVMIIIASLVLFKLAQESLDQAKKDDRRFPRWFVVFVNKFDKLLNSVNAISGKFLKYFLPNLTMKPRANLTFWGLLTASITVPFILGLDNFAGYIPVFTIVNVFGFIVGVFAGHMLLNMALFISPKKTIVAVKNPIISVGGGVVFVGLAVWGFYEGLSLFFHL